MPVCTAWSASPAHEPGHEHAAGDIAAPVHAIVNSCCGAGTWTATRMPSKANNYDTHGLQISFACMHNAKQKQCLDQAQPASKQPLRLQAGIQEHDSNLDSRCCILVHRPWAVASQQTVRAWCKRVARCVIAPSSPTLFDTSAMPAPLTNSFPTAWLYAAKLPKVTRAQSREPTACPCQAQPPHASMRCQTNASCCSICPMHSSGAESRTICSCSTP